MEKMHEMECRDCESDDERMSEEEISKAHIHVRDWKIVERDDMEQLERIFIFSDFDKVVEFITKIGEIVTKEGHYPVILIDEKRVKVNLRTRKVKGLHRNDFIIAAKIDQRYPRGWQH